MAFPTIRSACPRCEHLIKAKSNRLSIIGIRTYSVGHPDDQGTTEYQEDFGDVVGELKRRRRKADSKRRQYGNTFVDHVLVTVRGGKGGSGAAALQATLRGAGPLAPCGGNGGSGGSVYLTTSPSLSSLTTLKKRVIGGQGSSGSGAFKHGKRGEDVLITVPIGTIVKEIRREGEEERSIREEEELGLNEDEKKKRKWQRWIITHPSTGGEVSREEYIDAENLLKKEGRWNIKTPNFQELPPIELDLDIPLKEPILLGKGGLGGLGNPFFNSPRIASKGFLPPIQTFEFELKLLSDIGLVGLPNSGKSTILKNLTGKKTEIANYQFTTLNPQIGVVRVFEGENDDEQWEEEKLGQDGQINQNDFKGNKIIEESWIEREKEDLSRLLGGEFPSSSSSSSSFDDSIKQKGKGKASKVEKIRFTISDNPGLLPLASENVGLGHNFLRSIERSPILIYVLDFQNQNPENDFKILKNELENYKSGLSKRANIIILNKADKVDEKMAKEKLIKLQQQLLEEEENEENDNDKQKIDIIITSGKYNLGMKNLINLLVEKVQLARQQQEQEKVEKEKESSKLNENEKKIGSFGLKKLI
ncbi:uncharacterized protein L201_007596 [Kwoniella dendrophila CBS 6074]|uniref:GTPase n=1 Tax=Kwoniella dendrophila CBS 6074 TaxID=1295534 RepID=A0AAX4K6Z3_9TREE